MKLKKIDQTRFDMIKNMIESFVSMGQDLEMVMTGLKPQIAEFEREVGVKLKVDVDAVEKVTLIDLRKDYMRTRFPNAESMVFRAKTQGVPVEVKIYKAGEYEFTNLDIVESLKALISKVEALDVEIKDMEQSDFKGISDTDEDDDLKDEFQEGSENQPEETSDFDEDASGLDENAQED